MLTRLRSYLFLFLSFYSIVSYSLNIDRYIGPLGTFNYPLFSVENSYNTPVISSGFRYGFRVEAGSLSDNVSFDFRFNNRSSYTDYGILFRYFKCWGLESSFSNCPGLGLGVSYSPGFLVDPAGRSFTDLLVNANWRWMWDVGPKTVFVLDTGLLVVPTRSFSTSSPIESDSKAKMRAEVSMGFISDFVELGESIGFGQSQFSRGEQIESGLKFGLKGGFPLSKFVGVDAAGNSLSSSRRTGILGGLSLSSASRGLGFEMDLFYATRRFGITDSTSGIQERVELPIFLKYQTPGTTFLYFNAGGFGAYPIGNASVVSGTVTTSVSEAAYGLDYGYGFGVGGGIQAESVMVTFEFRLLNGLANLVQNPSGTESSESRLLDLLVGFYY